MSKLGLKHPLTLLTSVAISVSVGVIVVVGLLLWTSSQTRAVSVQASALNRATNRSSVVFTCEVYNDKTVAGITKLVKQLRGQASTSPVRTQQEKDAEEAGFQALLSDFPLLDCSANPIRLQTPVTRH